jgi:chromosome segregation ATPase
MFVTTSVDTGTLQHKIDLILESTLEMERKQIQVASIRSEMHKFLVDLSHLNNAPPEEDEKYESLDSLIATMEQRFVSTKNDISALQRSISTLKCEIGSMIGQHSKAIEHSWRIESERREQIWQDRLMEERGVWNERLMEERKQWQQYMRQHTFQLDHMLKENMKQWRQEYCRSNTEMLSRVENRTFEMSEVLGQPVNNIDHSPANIQGSSNTSVSQPTVPTVGIISVGMSNLSIEASTPRAAVTSASSAARGPISVRPPRVSIKGLLVKDRINAS